MKSKGKKRLLALVLCMVVALSNSSFIFASETMEGEYPQEAEVQAESEAAEDVAAAYEEDVQPIAEEESIAVESEEEAPAAERIQRRQPEPKAARPQPRRAVEAGEEEEEPVTIGSLAMPSLSAAQLANRVKKAGDAPDIVKDDITNVTLFDYSDIISGEADDMEE